MAAVVGSVCVVVSDCSAKQTKWQNVLAIKAKW